MTDSSTGCAKNPVPAGLTDPDAVPDAASHSRYVQRIRRRYAGQMPLLADGAPLRPAMQATLDALLAGGLDTGAALRVLRQLVIERLAVLDCGAPTLPTACGPLPTEGALPLQGATPPEAAHLQAVQARAGGFGAAACSLQSEKAGPVAPAGI
ncbi:MAG: (Glutamate--ammonia-ligase) adenylyltransferase [Polaromonas sp.]|nr:(Glutamate--ammonia-ligase) adenylyltransferase [Polaromonas sp.]